MSAILDITLPADQLEGTTAKVSEWLVECGAEVTEGDPLLELETDKVTMEICAPGDGSLAEILKAPGDDVGPDSILGKLTSRAAVPTDTAIETRAAIETPVADVAVDDNVDTNADANIDIKLSEEQLEGTAAKISEWLVEVGSQVSKGEPLMELETDKVTMEICATEAGQLAEIYKRPGDKVEPGIALGRLSTGAAKPPTQAEKPQQAVSEQNASASVTTENTVDTNDVISAENSARHLLGPAVRRLLRENDLDINLITGSGRRGRVTREDVQTFINNPQSKVPAAGSTSSPVSSSPAPRSGKTAAAKLTGNMVPHTPMRKAIANHMVKSLLHTSPHVTSVFEMDMSNIIEHRRWHKKEFAEQGAKLTFTAYFLAATVKAMAAVPQMNARYHDEALELFEDINIGVGTALGDDGLVVPVVQQVQTKKLFDIASALQAQTDKARNGKLTPADMKNGTFTISNHGVSGSLFAAPIIINQPQVAILGIGKLEKRVVVTETNGEDTMSIKPMCYVSLSIDHRAVDAFQTNKFLSVFVDCIENWGE